MTMIRLAIDTSQSVKAYSASTIFSASTPDGHWISISTFSEVKSWIAFTFNLPLRTASSIAG